MTRAGDAADFPPYALDDDLIAAARAAGEPRLRVAAFAGAAGSPVAVVLGRGGRPERELHLDAILADGRPVLRRSGGGCAVVLDPGNIVVSAALPRPGLGGITSAFAALSAWLAAALARCGLPGAGQAGVSDLALDGRKIGGACIHRTLGLLYYSTTLLVAPDLALIERYLPHPPREPAYRAGRAHRAFLLPLAPRLAAAGLASEPAAFAARLASELGLPPA